MRVALMIEGQEGVTWPQWVALALACDEHGVEALFRSDHYLSVVGRRERGSLDAWATICALAAVTESVRLGTLVSPVTFRHPSLLAKVVATADHVSGGRVELGMGTGWLEEEHTAHGFEFPALAERMGLLEEQVDIVRRSWADGPFSFDGRHYRLAEVDALPKPLQRPGPPLIVGGGAGPRSAALAARFADEYNVFSSTPEQCRDQRAALDAACEREGRDPATLPLSLMAILVLGSDGADLESRMRTLEARDQAPERPVDASVVGTLDQAIEGLRAFEAAGVERVMLKHPLHDDLDTVVAVGRELAPAVT